MDNSDNLYLIIGLGNPGKSYEGTRHNIGFSIVGAFAKKKGFVFKNASQLFGELAQGVLEEKRVLLFRPKVFMNESGTAVLRCVNYYRIPHDRLMVVSDDTALELSYMRLRAKGSSGGHNGLKSVEEYLKTQHYPRLRFGIGTSIEADMKDYVLDKFKSEESLLVDEMIEKAVHILELWISAGIAIAMREANTRKKSKDKDDMP